MRWVRGTLVMSTALPGPKVGEASETSEERGESISVASKVEEREEARCRGGGEKGRWN